MDIKEQIFELTRTELEKIYISKIDLKRIKLCGSYENKEKIISALREQPLTVVNQLIPYIKTKNIEREASMNTDDDNYRELSTVNIYDDLHIKQFSIITSVDDLEYIFTDCSGNLLSEMEMGVESKIAYYGSHSGDIRVEGKYGRPTFQPDLTLLDLEWSVDIKINCKIMGILREDDIPSWVYYLVEGCVNYNDDNINIGIFNIFAALDNFIENMNVNILDYYLSNYTRILDEIKSKYPKDMEYQLDAKSYLKDKIKRYCRDTRRLDEKLKDIMKEVGIKGDNSGFSKLLNMWKSEFKSIEKYRNRIAHGELCNEYDVDFAACLYFILTIILSILHVRDFEKDEWQYIIEREFCFDRS